MARGLSFPVYTTRVIRSFDGEIVLFLLGLFQSEADRGVRG